MGTPVMGKSALGLSMAPVLMALGVLGRVQDLGSSETEPCHPRFNTSYLPEVPKGVIYEENELRGAQAVSSLPHHCDVLSPKLCRVLEDLNRVSKSQLFKIQS